MVYNKSKGKTVLEQENILGTQIADFDNSEYVQLELKDECRIPKHELPVNVDFFVVEGEGNIEIGDDIVPIKSGDLTRVPAGTPRGVISSAGKSIKLLVIKGK